MDFSRLHDLGFLDADHLVVFDADEVLRPCVRGLLLVLILHARVLQVQVALLFLQCLGVLVLLDQ